MAAYGRGRGFSRSDLMIVLAIGGLLVAVVAKTDRDSASGQTAGRPRVIDGDTLAFGQSRVRLAGIDAPELGQSCRQGDAAWDCGKAAKTALFAMIGDGDVTCDAGGSDRYGRLLAVCRDAGGRDLNGAMVRSGMAVAFGDYEADERAAAAERAGLWAGDFERPRDWRRKHGGLDEMPHFPPGWLADLWRRIAGLFG